VQPGNQEPAPSGFLREVIWHLCLSSFPDHHRGQQSPDAAGPDPDWAGAGV